jgi:hypothetical protein
MACYVQCTVLWMCSCNATGLSMNKGAKKCTAGLPDSAVRPVHHDSPHCGLLCLCAVSQSVAGAVSTGTHGSNLGPHKSMSHQVSLCMSDARP